ncbi:MAG: CotH kinase family protein [Bacteroidetes bacterium]|nr:CotH kinase family protein [Bacteroidota bacterium]MBP6650086.1 CotH kinase family protein [Bacteroidia bacterium]
MNKFLFRSASLVFAWMCFNTFNAVAQKTTNPSTTTAADKKVKDYGKDFFSKDSIHVVKLYFSQCNYWDSLAIYKKLNDSLESSQFMQATVIIDGKKFYACGLRFKGESSYDFYPGKKKPFRIKFDKFIKGQNFNGLEDLNLTNNFKDPTMVREKIYLDLMNKHGLPAPRATYAKVYINDKYWGLYLANENIDNVFLETRFGNSKGNLFQGEPMATFVYLGNDQDKYWPNYILKTNKTRNDWSDLVKFIKVINDTNLLPDNYLKRLEATFELNTCLKAWAINNLIGNIDAYNVFYPHNYFIYHDTITTKWNWISLDGNYSFAAWNPIMNFPQLTRMSIMVPDSTPYKGARPLLDRTLGKNIEVQKRYLAIVEDLLNTDFKPERMNHVIDSLSLRIRVSVYADVNKMYSNTDYDTNISSNIGDPLDPGNFIPGLKAYLSERRVNILNEIDALKKKLD